MAIKRDYYIAPKALVLAHAHQMHPFHYLELDDGMVLVSSNFHTDEQQELWETLTDVTNVQDSIDEAQTNSKKADAATDEPKHVKHLKKLGITKDHSFKEVIKAAKSHHRLM